MKKKNIISVYINFAKKNSARVLQDLLNIGMQYDIHFMLLKTVVKKTAFKKYGVSLKKFINECTFAIVIGGDGTFISAAHVFMDTSIPLLGINTGNFGFLAEVAEKEISENIKNIVANKIKIEERMILECDIVRHDKVIKSSRAINEFVVHNTKRPKLIKVCASVNNHYIGTFSGDGIIVSSPTGSTAYSLSANGPIVFPTMDSFILNTICPHTLALRPIIIPADASIVLEIISKYNNISFNYDGLYILNLRFGDKIIIKKYRKNLKIITSPDRNFFDILRVKFNWIG